MRYGFYRFVRSCGSICGFLAVAVLWLPLSVRSAENAALISALNSITADELQLHVDVLADDTFEGRAAGSRGGHAAGNLLASYFKEQGLDAGGERASYFQGFNGSRRNILGILPGTDPEHQHEFILISAHYDHVGYGNARNSYGPTGYIHNGADDNASGVAAVLEIIQAFGTIGERPRRSILFALWDGEEEGLLGSKHWAAYPTIDLKNVQFALNMDMVGRLRDSGVEVYGVRTGSGLRKLVSLANRDSQLPLRFLWEMKANSDHYSMFERNIPVLMLHTGLHDDYHRPSDDADKINAEGIRSVAALAFQICWDAAETQTAPVFRRASFSESPGAQRDFERQAAPPPKRLGISWRPEETGLTIIQVTSGSAADRAGLKIGDMLVEFNGKPIGNDGRFSAKLLAANSEVQFGVRRAAKEELETIPVTLDGDPMRVGLRWRPDPADATAFYITQVVAGSPADLAGIKPGDWLYDINGLAFTSSDELAVWLKSATGELELAIERRGRVMPVKVQLEVGE